MAGDRAEHWGRRDPRQMTQLRLREAQRKFCRRTHRGGGRPNPRLFAEWHSSCTLSGRMEGVVIEASGPSTTANEILESLRHAAQSQSRLRILYSNSEGLRSSRDIRPFRIYRSRYGVTYIQAFCYLKNETRTFRADRVIAVGPAASPMEPILPTVPLSPARPYEPPWPQRVEAPSAQPEHRRGGLAALAVIGLLVIGVVALLRNADSQAQVGVALSTPVAAAARAALSGAALPAASTAPDLRDAYLAVNAALFEKRTGIHDRRLEAIYAAADSDRNGQLSWAEIKLFQRAVYHIFAYKENDTALRPDQFIDQGGGDCEDWALFTAGLLRYWGWNAEIAGFESPSRADGHAVAFVRVANPIPGIGSYTIVPEGAASDRGLRSGTYIPIDYDEVGSLSSAVGRGWRLVTLWENPESLYGRVM